VIVELGFVWLPESHARKKAKFVFAWCEVEKARDKIRPDSFHEEREAARD